MSRVADRDDARHHPGSLPLAENYTRTHNSLLKPTWKYNPTCMPCWLNSPRQIYRRRLTNGREKRNTPTNCLVPSETRAPARDDYHCRVWRTHTSPALAFKCYAPFGGRATVEQLFIVTRNPRAAVHWPAFTIRVRAKRRQLPANGRLERRGRRRVRRHRPTATARIRYTLLFFFCLRDIVHSLWPSTHQIGIGARPRWPLQYARQTERDCRPLPPLRWRR